MDNTNLTKQKREQFIKLAKENGYQIVCIKFDYPKDFAMRLNYLRKFRYYNETNFSVNVPNIALHMFYKVHLYNLITKREEKIQQKKKDSIKFTLPSSIQLLQKIFNLPTFS